LTDLFSPDYFNKKLAKIMADAKYQPFEPWSEAKERYIRTKLEPMHDLYRESDHDWFKSFHRRKGDVMHHSDLILKIQKLNPHVFVQQQINFPDDWGLYTEALGRIQFLTGVPKGWLTEFSYSVVDDRNLPTEEKRGWRTVVIYCLMKGALSWAQVMQEFGDPTDGFNDARWQDVTHAFRHGGDAIAQLNICNAVD
jgi:hypothetical protein